MRVLVSGAGIAGPALAWWLARCGHSITIVEKSSQSRATGQNIDISGAAITIAKKMNILDEIRKWNSTEKGTQLIDSNGQPFAPFPLREGGLSGTNEFEILRGDLAQIFYEASKHHANVEYLFGTTVKTIHSNDEKNVKVLFSNGEEHTFDLLVAADGQWSAIRKQVFPASSIKVRELGMFVANWTIERKEGDNNWWNIYPGLNRRLVSTRPDPHGTIRVMATHMPTTEQKRKDWTEATRSDRATQMDLVRRDFHDVGWQMPRFLEGMEAAGDFYYWPMQQIQMMEWSKGRVILLGDAAYAPSPLTGSGTPLAIIGAYCLAGELSKIAQDGQTQPYDALRAALEAYESLYHPWIIERQNSIPYGLPGLVHPRTKFQRWLLSLVFSTFAKILNVKWVAKWLAQFGDGEENTDGFDLPRYPELEKVEEKNPA